MAKDNDDIQKLLDSSKEKNEEGRGAEKWTPNEGDTLQGILIKTGWYDGGTYAPSLWIMVKDMGDGEVKRVYASTVLANQLREEMPRISSGIAIRYEGRKPTQDGSRKYHAWTLALVPDKNGVVHRDEDYWERNGQYRGAQKATVQTTSDASEDMSESDFF